MSPGAPTLQTLVDRARELGDPGVLLGAIPCARLLGMSVEPRQQELLARLSYAPHLIGNSHLPALHGGAVATLLESTAFLQLLWGTGAPSAPRIISITVDYLRTARAVDTFARADITRQGRRIATVHAQAWQEDPARPVATARAHFLLALAERPPG